MMCPGRLAVAVGFVVESFPEEILPVTMLQKDCSIIGSFLTVFLACYLLLLIFLELPHRRQKPTYELF